MQEFLKFIISAVGRNSSVRVATELWAARSGDRIPVREKLFGQVQTGPGTNPAYCTMGTVSFPELNSGGGVTALSPILVP